MLVTSNTCRHIKLTAEQVIVLITFYAVEACRHINQIAEQVLVILTFYAAEAALLIFQFMLVTSNTCRDIDRIAKLIQYNVAALLIA